MCNLSGMRVVSYDITVDVNNTVWRKNRGRYKVTLGHPTRILHQSQKPLFISKKFLSLTGTSYQRHEIHLLKRLLVVAGGVYWTAGVTSCGIQCGFDCLSSVKLHCLMETNRHAWQVLYASPPKQDHYIKSSSSPSDEPNYNSNTIINCKTRRHQFSI